jgi:hypothetical protein
MVEERRVVLAQQVGEIAGTIKGISAMLERMDKKLDDTADTLAAHVTKDSLMRADVDEIQEWRKGSINSIGAEEELKKIGNQRYWLYGAMAAISMSSSAFGAWASKLLDLAGK